MWLSLNHPFVTLASMATGAGTLCLATGQAVKDVSIANPNLSAIAVICGSLATIFSAIVAIRHPRRSWSIRTQTISTEKRRRKPKAITSREPTKKAK